jgi:glutamyl/glutaminyl-tRNA synthetase
LRELLEPLSAIAWNREAIEAAIRGLAERSRHKAGDYISPMRVAITGVAVSAGLFETAEVLGKEITLGRIDAFLRKVRIEEKV